MVGLLPSTGFFIDSKGRIIHFEPPPKIENLVLEGGGARGLVYTGALNTPEMRDVLKGLKRVAGSSAGALTATLLGLGYSPSEIGKLGRDFDLETLKDLSDSKLSNTAAKIQQGIVNLSSDERGLFLGNKLLNEVRRLVQDRVLSCLTQLIADANPHRRKIIIEDLKKIGLLTSINDNAISIADAITFKHIHHLAQYYPELGFKKLFLTGTNVTRKQLEIFNNESSPDMEVALAVRISMSIPVMFKRVSYNGCLYEDGGCLKNFPMDIFENPLYRSSNGAIKAAKGQNLATLGFRVDAQKEMREVLWNEKAKPKDTSSVGIAEKLWEGIKNEASRIWDRVVNKISASAINYVTDVDVQKASQASTQMTRDLYAQRTIQINDKGYDLAQFKLSDQDKEILRQSGEDATKNWFQQHRGELSYEKFDALKDMPKEKLNAFYLFIKDPSISVREIFPTSKLPNEELEKQRQQWIKEIGKINNKNFDPRAIETLIARLKQTLNELDIATDARQVKNMIEHLKSDERTLSVLQNRYQNSHEELFSEAQQLIAGLKGKIASLSLAQNNTGELEHQRTQSLGLFVKKHAPESKEKTSLEEPTIRSNKMR